LGFTTTFKGRNPFPERKGTFGPLKRGTVESAAWGKKKGGKKWPITGREPTS